jgi:hypothetical protein
MLGDFTFFFLIGMQVPARPLARKFLFFRAEPTKKLPELTELPDFKALGWGNSGDSGDFLTGRESKCEYFSRRLLPSFRLSDLMCGASALL